MTAYSLTAGPTAQWWNGTDGSIAGLSELTVANLSDGDDVIVSIYGEPASATCGFRIFPGESLSLLPLVPNIAPAQSLSLWSAGVAPCQVDYQ